MIRSLLCIALLACSSTAVAADWQREFFSSMTSELPASHGLAVDEQGFVHAQAFNRQPWSIHYELAHFHTFDAQGQTPWMRGVSMTNRKSSCGVFAKSGQRLDCFVHAGWYGDETRLQMQANDASQTSWQTVLPPGIKVLDASIADNNVALFVGRIEGAWGAELGVFRTGGYGLPEVLSVTPACPLPWQAPVISHFRMPDAPGESIRHIKACPTGFGTTELISEQFDAFSGQWTTLAQWSLPFGANITHAAMNADGKGFVLIDHGNGFRQLLFSGVFGDMWLPMPIPDQGGIAAFLANERTLAIAFEGTAPDAVDVESAVFFDLQGGFWPQFASTPVLSIWNAQAFALSSEGALLIAGNQLLFPQTSHHLWQVDRFGQYQPVAPLTLAANETTDAPPILRAGPNNVAVVARTITREEFFGDPQIGLRVQQIDLPI